MLSRNNYKEKLRKMEPKKERFSIRKFSIGAASVLIGLSFMSMTSGQKAEAATEPDNTSKTSETNENVTTGNPSDDLHLSKNSSVDTNNSEKLGGATTGTESQSTDDSKSTQSSTQNTSNDVEKGTSTDQNKESETKAENTAKDVKTAVSKENNETAVKEEKVAKEAANTAKVAAAPTSQGQTQEVSDWNSFGHALVDANVGTIKLTGNITANGGVTNAINNNYGELDVTASDIARKLTIDGQGEYSIDFGTNFLAFTNANQGSNNSAWDLTLKDVTINGDGYQRTIYKGG